MEAKDFLGRTIREGDYVARAIHSSHTFHKVVKITEKGIRLSRGTSVREYQTRWYRGSNGRYEWQDTPITQQYTVFGGANSISEIENHTSDIYLRKDRVSLVLV